MTGDARSGAPMRPGAASASVRCLLCRGSSVEFLEGIPTAELAQAYRSELSLNCDFQVQQRIDYLVCTECDLRFFSPPVTGNESFYAQLQNIPWYYSADKQEFRIAAPYVRSGARVLEIGAGRGLFTRHITAAGSYTGLEFSSAAIEAAAASGVRLLPETIEQHAVHAGASYEVVCSFQVLEHVGDPRGFLDAAIACLRPGGQLIVSVPAEDSFARFAYWDVLNLPPHHVTRWSDKSLRAIAAICGVQAVAVIPEPLGKNMRRACARAVIEERLARMLGWHLRQLDPRLKRPLFKAGAGMAAAVLRRWLALSGSSDRRGHAVLAVFRK